MTSTLVANEFPETQLSVSETSQVPPPAADFQTLKPPVLFYHVATMGPWKDIVREQLTLLVRAGFDGTIMIGMCGPDRSRFPHELACELGLNSPEIIARSMHLDEYEFPTLRALEAFCRTGYDGPIGYCHTKAASGETCTKRLWRWIMNRAILVEWRDRIQDLQTHDASGFCWEQPRQGNVDHFCGNFWWARASWIRKLSGLDWYIGDPWHSMSSEKDRRLCAEFWISSNNLRNPQRKIKSVYLRNAAHGHTPIWDQGWWDARPDMFELAMGGRLS